MRFLVSEKRGVGRVVSLLALIALSLPAAAQENSAVSLSVRLDKPGIPVAKSLYGVFFEEINHAGDGGLYAELVQNRDFEQTDAKTGLPLAWSLRTDGQAQAKMTVDTAHPLTPANPKSLRLDMTGTSGTASLFNGGFWGIAVRKGASYNLSLYARRSAERGDGLRVCLQSATGTVYAQTTLRGLTPEWKRFTVRLTAAAADPAAHLALVSETPGTLWLDMVSLFPADTYKRRANGLRLDLAEHVSAMHPAFVRFPGGCFVEGDRLPNAFRWQTTLGDLAQRPGHLNDVWVYRSTDGLGYHEYLQWCEDMGAEPLFVVNCGLAHKDVVPMDKLDPWVQEALDAIEYANGAVSTKWGALRAKNGHPAPFKLRYIEIGNENGMFGGSGGTLAQYNERYRRFYDAIKSRYPDILTIANTRVSSPMEIVDDHYYNSPAWFWNNMNRYDNAPRTGPKVYVGEYAVTSNCGKGNLRAALAEAAFMVGMERNADLITMSSYAPLFVNANDRRWNPDAIVFDSARSYGTPSYYVQKLFSEYRPDTAYPIAVSSIAPPAVEKGSVGLGTWRTQAEYKDLEITQNGQTLYRTDFAQTGDWHTLSGDWKTADGVYRQTNEGENERALLTLPRLNDVSDYTIRLKARKISGAEGFLILFRAHGDNEYYWWNIGGWRNTEHGIEKIYGGSYQIGNHVRGQIETGRWYDVRIELTGNRIRCYLDDKLIHDVTEQGVPNLAAIAGRRNKTGEIIIKIVNGAETPRSITLKMEGVGALQPTGEAITLTSGTMDDENELTAPDKVMPRTQRIQGVTPTFTHTYPARSLTILRLKAR